MKTKSLLTSILLCLAFGIFTCLNTSFSSGFGSYQNGCSCHNPTPSVNTIVSITNLPTFYNVNTAYPISVTVSNPTKVAAGFQIQTNIGTLTTTDPGITINPGNKSAGHNQRKFFVGTSATFNLTWTSPAVGGTAANFDAVGNAVNNNTNNTGDEWNTAAPTNVALSVQFLSMTAQQNNTAIDINFSTINEKNVSHFEIQKSTDGQHFSTINEVVANSQKKYQYKDAAVRNGEIYFYRIAEISTQNHQTFSNITSVKYTRATKPLMIYPSLIIGNLLTINAENMVDDLSLTLYNFAGQPVFTARNIASTISIPALPNGNYIANLRSNNESVLVQKITLSR